ncbi:uncharacterized protein LOC134228754, partial [Saccostrea cucullata]|uniref:uncharacterized protein LOC134228754 n=1 Tax=Saccostrea cuccullata TaxID=36930 RepID=UPI002ED1F544
MKIEAIETPKMSIEVLKLSIMRSQPQKPMGIFTEVLERPSFPKSLRPKLYVIFADNPYVFDHEEPSLRKWLEEIKEFGIKTGMPCYVVARKILFYKGNAIVHKQTTNAIVKTLITMNISTIYKGDPDGGDEFLYFTQMIKNLSADFPLPIIVSLGNGKASEKVLDFAMGDKIPIIFFKISGDDASVLTDLNICQGKGYKGLEHQFKMKAPWQRERIKPLNISFKKSNNQSLNEIVFLSDLLCSQSLNVDAILCYLLIGVLMASPSDRKYSVFGKLTTEYPNILSMYLLKEGQWNIPKPTVESAFPKHTFNKKSIEYIGGK